MSTVEALHELRRMAQPTCWRCKGEGQARFTTLYGWVYDTCPSCAGTGAPERVA